MKLSLNGSLSRHGHGYIDIDQYYSPQSTTQFNAISGKKSMESLANSSSKRRWWSFTQDTFTTPTFFPRFLVVLAAAFSLFSTFYMSAYYNYPFNINPSMTIQVQLRRDTGAKPATILKARKEADTTESEKCKWAQYADWPYVSKSSDMLSPYRRKLLYVKTPKSSSSTTAHILQRYTSREGLIVGYPNFAGNEWTFQTERSLQDALMRQNVTEFDAIVSHIIYNRTAVDSALGIPEISSNAGKTANNNNITNTIAHQGSSRPFRITSVREPVARTWSMYAHGSTDPAAREFKMGAHNPMEFARSLDYDGQLNYAAGYRYGVQPATVENVARHYDHIVVSERVLESFLTLAPKLGLHVDDLLYISQKRYGYAKKSISRRSNMTEEDKSATDAIISQKTRLDTELHRLANARLDAELRALPDTTRRFLKDIPAMMREMRKVCGKIGPENNSCLTQGEIMWDGNQMCLARCIQRWANRNVWCGEDLRK